MSPAAPAQRSSWPTSRCRDLVQDTAARVADMTGLPPLSSPGFCAPQMVAMPLPETDPAALKTALLTDYAIEIPVFKWPNHTIARVSAQGYNTAAQMDHLVTALRHLLARHPVMR